MSVHPPGLGRLSECRFQAVLFDLDGTLIDSTAAVLRAWQRWAAERGLTEPPRQIPHGVPARQVLATVVAPDEVEAAFERLEALEIQEVDGISVLPGALRALRAVPPDRMAIVTSGTPPLAMARIAATGVPAPPLVITPDDVPLGKPDPAPYRLAAERLGVEASRCLVVEDAPAGLDSGVSAGCRTLALTTSHPAQDLIAHHPDAVADSLADVTFVVVNGDIVLQ